jgi:hypothetical protein
VPGENKLKLTLNDRRSLFVQAMAQFMAAAGNRGRAKPHAVAHRAYEFASAALEEVEIQASAQTEAARRGRV